MTDWACFQNYHSLTFTKKREKIEEKKGGGGNGFECHPIFMQSS